LINVTSDGVLLKKDGDEKKKQKGKSFGKEVFKGGLELLSYDSASLH